MALSLDGSMPPAEIAKRFEIDPMTVRKLAASVADIDPIHVATLKRALPSILTMLGAAHGIEALARVHDDPAMAVKSTFGAKLAVEAARLSLSQTDAPGIQILTLIQSYGTPVEGEKEPLMVEGKVVPPSRPSTDGDSGTPDTVHGAL